MTEKKKILFVGQFYSPEYVTDSILAQDITKALSEDFEVSVLTGYPYEFVKNGDKKVPKTETIGNIKVKRFKYIYFSRGKAFSRLLNYLSFMSALLFHLGFARKKDGVITATTPPVLPVFGCLAAKLFHAKSMLILYDAYPEIPVVTGECGENSLLVKVMGFINKKVYKRLSLCIALTEEMRNFVIEKRGVAPEKAVVISNWHRDLAKPDADNQALPEQKPLTVSFLGNMGKCQDLQTITDAIDILAQNNSDIRFIFAGRGTLQDEFYSKINYKNARCCDYLVGDDYKKALEESDVFLLSLKKGLDGLCAPSRFYSYLMMGKPVVAVSDEKDIKRVIEKYDVGAEVANGDAKLLAETLENFAKNPERLKTMGKNARKAYEENYTPSICLAKYRETIKKLMETP